MIEKTLIIPESGLDQDNMEVATFDEAFLISLTVLGHKSDMAIERSDLVRLHDFISKHLEQWK